MQNIELQPRTRSDIDQQIEKLLRGIGNPEPPLRLANLRTALQLDLQFTENECRPLCDHPIQSAIAGMKAILIAFRRRTKKLEGGRCIGVMPPS